MPSISSLFKSIIKRSPASPPPATPSAPSTPATPSTSSTTTKPPTKPSHKSSPSLPPTQSHPRRLRSLKRAASQRHLRPQEGGKESLALPADALATLPRRPTTADAKGLGRSVTASAAPVTSVKDEPNAGASVGRRGSIKRWGTVSLKPVAPSHSRRGKSDDFLNSLGTGTRTLKLSPSPAPSPSASAVATPLSLFPGSSGFPSPVAAPSPSLAPSPVPPSPLIVAQSSPTAPSFSTALTSPDDVVSSSNTNGNIFTLPPAGSTLLAPPSPGFPFGFSTEPSSAGTESTFPLSASSEGTEAPSTRSPTPTPSVPPELSLPLLMAANSATTTTTPTSAIPSLIFTPTSSVSTSSTLNTPPTRSQSYKPRPSYKEEIPTFAGLSPGNTFPGLHASGLPGPYLSTPSQGRGSSDAYSGYAGLSPSLYAQAHGHPHPHFYSSGRLSPSSNSSHSRLSPTDPPTPATSFPDLPPRPENRNSKLSVLSWAGKIEVYVPVARDGEGLAV
ncbi:hypothetical protein DACRYDRAFT_118152 [Dacryopinax primogenitus]|uniref:Uncharacterized protein n=1 Tax=Dacryopinax primogenitus (strain DJM 731) TaxID=1858805 RepID=M5FV30_DACPD|nr:uncharacterized protein DACRYDRAFT_118152 [Dacryopinax primogenitus]EJT99439.1 hypothetical protein DACRYDRAFT_118152 [Dacryopinax primogenitus]